MTTLEIRCKIERLQKQYQAEMIRQNNKNSVERSYSIADDIKREIAALRAKL